MTYGGSVAQAGRGTTFSIGGTPTLVGEVKTCSLGGGKWETADVTNFESGADREFITTLRDNGTVDIAGNRAPSDAGQVLLEAAYQSGAVTAFVIQLPKTAAQTTSGDKYAFSALVLSRDCGIDVTKEVDLKASLKISGPVTFTAGS